MAESSPADRQFLNAADRLMLVAHNGLRSLGHPGFQCQTHAWLDDQLDVPAFQATLARLARHFPVVTSRLAPAEDRRGPVWRFDPAHEVEFAEHELAGSSQSDVLRWSESLFETPQDLDSSNPISFHLLHLHDARQVLVIRFSHALMDGKSPELVLKEIDRLHGDPGADTSPSRIFDEMQAHLLRSDRKRRLQATARVIRSHIHLPGRALRLSRVDAPKWVLGPLRAKLHTLDAEQTAVISARARRLCGFPNLCAVMLASVFRSVVKHSPGQANRCAILQTDVPINLRPPMAIQPIFCNFMSFIGVRMRLDQVIDRDAATQEITVQMRQQLRKSIDLGNLQMMHFMSRFDRALASHIKSTLQRSPFTLGFGFQGPVISGLERFCGLPISQIYSLIACLHPPGMAFQVNQFRGRTNLMLTYAGGAVSDEIAEAFLNTVVNDLLG